MKKKFTILITAAFMLLTMMAQPGRAWGQSRETKTYKLTIDGSNFNTTSYAANNNEKTSNAVNIADNTDTYEVTWTSNQVMKNGTNMQWQKSKGYIYNSTNLGTITNVTVTSSAGSFTTYYGTSEQPSSGTAGSGKGYFKTSVGGATGTSSKMEITFQIETGGSSLQDNDLALTGAPIALSFDLYNNSDAQVINYTTSSTGAVTIADNQYFTKVIDEVNKTITITPVEVTPTAQTITVIQAADATYAAGTATFTVTVANSTPTVNVIYHANGGTGDDIEETPYQGSDYTVAANTFSYTGYSFTKWNTNEGGTGTDYLPGATIENISEDIDLYAQWQESSSSEVVDYLDREFTGRPESTNYGNWSGKTGISGAVYAGNSAGDHNSIQLRTNGSTSGIVSTASAGKVTKVEVDWNSSTSAGRKIRVYGKNSAYSSAEDLYSANTRGTQIGTINYGSTTELTISDDYEYIGICSDNGALYLNWVKITWATASSNIVATPVINPNGGSFWESQEVSISCATDGATIYYTTDGNDPTTGSAVYSDPFTITANTTVKAFAVKTDMTNSEIATAEFTKGTAMTVAQALAVTPPQNGVYVGGIISEITEVSTQYHNATYTISDDGTHSSELTVFRGKYLNGANFTSEDQIQVGDVVVVYGDLGTYNEAIQLNQNNYLVSLVRPEKAATPTFSPAAGTYYAAQNVTINCETDGATIYYTTNGTNPTTESSVYSEAIAVNTTTTIKAFAVKAGINDSDIATAEYTIILTPSITVTPATANPSASDTEGTLDLTYANLTITDMDDFDIQYYDAGGDEATQPSWIEVGVAEQDPNIGEGYVVSYIMDANTVAEARTAYFKVYAMDGEEFVYSNLVTVTQAAFVVDYAELPFAFNGGRADIANTTGLTQEGLDSDYASAPKLKFNGTGDWVILKINERPGTLTFDLKGYNFSGSTFTVQTSENGVTYTDLKTYTDSNFDNTLHEEEFTDLGENIRYIKWIYTEKVQNGGNVALGNIALAEYVEPVASITVTPDSVEAQATGTGEGGVTEGSLTVTLENITITELDQLGVGFCDENGTPLTGTNTKPEWINTEFTYENEVYKLNYTIAANGETTERVAYFKVFEVYSEAYSNKVTVTQEAYVAPVASITVTPDSVEAQATGTGEGGVTEGSLTVTLENITITELDQLGVGFCDENGTPLTGTNTKPEWINTEFTYENEVYKLNYTIAANGETTERVAYFKVYEVYSEAYSNLVTVTQEGVNTSVTATINFTTGTGNTPINSASVSGNDSQNNTWTVITTGENVYFSSGNTNSQVGSTSRPAESITFTMSLPLPSRITGFSAKFGGSANASRGDITIKVGGTTIGSGNVYGTSAVTINNNETATGTDIMVVVNNITSGILCYYFSYTYEPSTDPALTAYDVNIESGATEGEIPYTLLNAVEGGSLEAEITDGNEGNWLTLGALDETLSFICSPNNGDERSATVTFTYTYDNSKETISATAVVTQEAYVAPVATIHYHFNAIDNDVPVYSLGETELETPNINVNGYTFVGWTTEPISDVSTSSTYFMTYNVQSDIDLYAVLAIEKYEQVTSAPTEGVYVLASKPDNNYRLFIGQSGTNTYGAGKSISEISSSEVGNNVITIAETENGYSIQFGDKYLGLTSDGNYLHFSADFSLQYYEWTFEPADEYMNISNVYYNTRYLRWNNSSPRFACYTSAQTPVMMFRNTSIYCTTVSEIPTTGGEMTGDYEILADQAFTITEPVTIPDGVTLIVNGVLGNTDATMLIIEDGGQLSNNSNSQIAATVKKNIKGHNPSDPGAKDGVTGYYLISSPIDDMDPDLAGMTTGWTYDLYKFDQTQNLEWQNYKQNHFNLEIGQGYLYANNDNDTLQFAGTIYNGDGKVTLTYDDNAAFNGVNLVGNPFTQDAYIDRSYYVMDDDGSKILPEAVARENAIKPMQGIFVVTENINDTVTFSKTYVSTANNNGSLTLNVNQTVNTRGESSNNLVDRAIVRFGVNDMLPKFQLNDNSSKIYFTEGNKDYAVVSAEAQGEMPVYFKAAENGTYTLSFSMNNVEFGYLHLIDNKTGNDVDLLQTPSYTFAASTIDYASRFRLVFRAIGNENDSENNDFGFFDANGNLLILGIEGTATLQVMDVTGRVISNETFSGDYSKAINASAGVYMLRLIQGSDVRTQKVVVK